MWPEQGEGETMLQKAELCPKDLASKLQDFRTLSPLVLKPLAYVATPSSGFPNKGISPR